MADSFDRASIEADVLRAELLRRIREKMLPVWVRKYREEALKRALPRSEEGTVFAFEVPDMSVFFEDPKFEKVHICKACCAICKIDPYRSERIVNGRVVYDGSKLNHKHVCPFADAEWHNDLDGIYEQVKEEKNKDKLMELARKYMNILEKYQKEISYYNENAAKASAEDEEDD